MKLRALSSFTLGPIVATALGVCLGIHVMNVAFGGTLLQHIPEDVPGAMRHEEEERGAPEHPVRIEPGSLLARALGVETAVVNSYHHQSVAKPAPGFRVSARSPDGIVEAIERDDHPFYLGVQWHPERMPDSSVTQRLLHAFVDAARGIPGRQAEKGVSGGTTVCDYGEVFGGRRFGRRC